MNDLVIVLEALRNAQETARAFHPLKRNAGRCLRQLERILLEPDVSGAMNRLAAGISSPSLAPSAGSEDEDATSNR